MASEKRLIDANALKEYLNSLEASGGHKYYRKGVDDTLHVHIPNIVDEQPTVDAVEVVLCKDCIYRHTRYACQGRSMDFYCASGKRVGNMEVK